MFDHTSYIRLLSQYHVDILGRFTRASSLAASEEFTSKLLERNGYQIICIDNKDGRFQEPNADNLLDRQFNVFYIVNRTSHDNFSGREVILKKCKEIFSEMVGMMNYHRMRGQHNIRNVDFDSFFYQTVGPLFDNFHGLMISYSVLSHGASKYDANKWTTTQF